MKYPCVTCDKDKLLYNINSLAELMHKDNRILSAVIKGFSADDDIVEILKNSKCDWLADSRIEDLGKIETQKKRFLIRSSQLSEVHEVIKWSDVSFESEISTISKLNDEARKQNVKHGIILAIDLGDLREGIFYKNVNEIDHTVSQILLMKNICLLGIGSNLGCFGGVVTDREKMNELASIAEHIENSFHIKLSYISGMTTAGYQLLKEGLMPRRINHGRFGEAWLLGHDPVSDFQLTDFHDDIFIFHAQLIEIKVKPSKPVGIIGGNAFGEHIVRDDQGIMKRGLLAFGTQDVNYNYLMPTDEDIELLGASSDHTIVNLTHAKKDYQIGDIITFKLKYHALLSIYTSKYVKKYIV